MGLVTWTRQTIDPIVDQSLFYFFAPKCSRYKTYRHKNSFVWEPSNNLGISDKMPFVQNKLSPENTEII
jgi:hypothetical protein